ncbi:MAG: DUF115 domain-containing protein [Spirochaetaceae bacterium]|nr:DUF115 domain-containing protein [Spirochaetaceae bacterium]
MNLTWNIRNNPIWEKNLRLFRARFPGLFALHEALFSGPSPLPPTGCNVAAARTGAVTLREDGIFLHSAYDPVQEAARLAESLRPGKLPAAPACPASPGPPLVFLGFGLGYLPLAAAARFPELPLVLVEPDVKRFALALAALDWEPVLTRRVCMLLVGAEKPAVIAALEQAGPFSGMIVTALPAVTRHARQYFADLQELIQRNAGKQRINDATLRRFGALWERNCRRNLHLLAELDGVNTLFGQGGVLWPGRGGRACVVAAGPSLETGILRLAAVKERAVVIAVDTALRSCLDAGVEPDVVVLADGQYWNARHIAGLAAPNALLVTEICAYPGVFRFPCRRIVLFDSANPVGAEYGKKYTRKGKLGAGGSVASAAWELARLLGCREIYLAGLDLGFPGKRTHARGSLFEQRSHRTSSRTVPQETAAAAALLSAPPAAAVDYAGTPLASDQRMSLYAWWFESAVAAHPECRTYSLCRESRAIPGVTLAAVGIV